MNIEYGLFKMRSGQTGKPCKTQEFLLRSLSIMEREHGPNSRMVAVALTNLSTLGLKLEFGKVFLVEILLKWCGRKMNETLSNHILLALTTWTPFKWREKLRQCPPTLGQCFRAAAAPATRSGHRRNLTWPPGACYPEWMQASTCVSQQVPSIIKPTDLVSLDRPPRKVSEFW